LELAAKKHSVDVSDINMIIPLIWSIWNPKYFLLLY
jgi:hypothetical protein